MKPTTPFAKADQMRLRQLKLERSQMPPPGRVMFWHGRKLLGHGDVATLGDFLAVPKQADTVCVSEIDYPEVKEWIDGK